MRYPRVQNVRRFARAAYSDNVRRRRGDRFDRAYTAVADLDLPPAVFKTCPWQPRTLVETGLRQWLRCCAPALRDNQVIGMTSHAVVEARHGLILCTAWYSTFCKEADGQFLHHHPTAAHPPTSQGSPIPSTSSSAGQSSHGHWSRSQANSASCGISTNVSVWTSRGASISTGSPRSRPQSQHSMPAAGIGDAV